MKITGIPADLALHSLTLTGDLTVGGGATVVGEMISESVYETLNSDKTSGAPTEDMGFRARRGASPWWVVGWDETNDRTIIGTSTDGTVANTTAGTVVVGNLSIGGGTLIAGYTAVIRAYLTDSFPLVITDSASLNLWYLNTYGTTVQAGGATFGDHLLVPNGSAAAPSYSFAAQTGTGIYRIGGALMSSVAGVWDGGFSNDLGSFMVRNDWSIGWAAGHQTTPDLTLYRDAANVLAQRNGTTAQEFRVYGTTTGPKYLSLSHTGVYSYIGTNDSASFVFGSGAISSNSWAVTGASLIPNNSGGVCSIGSTSERVKAIFLGGNTPAASVPMIDCSQTWNDAGVTFTGAKIAVTNTASGGSSRVFEVLAGAAGATSVFSVDPSGNIYVGTNVIAGGSFTVSGGLYHSSSGALVWTADGVMRLTDNAGTSFGRLCFGGTTSSFPAIKRNGSGVQVRLADDSGYGGFSAYDIQMFGNALYDALANKVVGAQGAAVADATGGATVDAEARTAINTLLARLRTHGLIAT